MLLGQLVDALHRVTRGELVLDPDLVRALVTRQRARDPLQELTEREQAVLTLLASGLSNAELGAQLYRSEPTIKTHLSSIFRKLGVRDRVQAVIAAYDAGLVAPAAQAGGKAPGATRTDR